MYGISPLYTVSSKTGRACLLWLHHTDYASLLTMQMMLPQLWINPCGNLCNNRTSTNYLPAINYLTTANLPPLQEMSLELHRNIIPLKVVNLGRFRNGPLPFLGPSDNKSFIRKANTAPLLSSRKTSETM